MAPPTYLHNRFVLPAGEKDPNVRTHYFRIVALLGKTTIRRRLSVTACLTYCCQALKSLAVSRVAHPARRQVRGGARTMWSISHPKVSRKLHWHWPPGQRFLRRGASRYPPFCVSFLEGGSDTSLGRNCYELLWKHRGAHGSRRTYWGGELPFRGRSVFVNVRSPAFAVVIADTLYFGGVLRQVPKKGRKTSWTAR